MPPKVDGAGELVCNIFCEAEREPNAINVKCSKLWKTLRKSFMDGPKEEKKPILRFDAIRVRRGVHWIVTQKVFDMFIMLVIVLSSIALALEDPVAEDENRILKIADYVFTGIFAMECSLKVGTRSMVYMDGTSYSDTFNGLPWYNVSSNGDTV